MQSVQFERQNRLVVCAKGKTCKKVLTKGFTGIILFTDRKGGRYREKKSPAKSFQKSFEKRLTSKIQSAIIKAHRTTPGRKEIRPPTKGDLP